MNPLPGSGEPPPGALEALLESLDSWTALVDLDGFVSVVNRGWAAYEGGNPFVAGLGPGDDYGAAVRKVTSSADGNLSIVALGLLAVLKGKVPRLRLEFPLKGDSTQWFGVLAVRSGGMVVFHHSDFTERMQIMQRLRKAETLFKATTEHALDLISVLDTDGKVVFTSHSHPKVLGYSEPEWKALRLEDLVHPGDAEAYLRNIRDAFRSGLSPFFEYRILNRSGAWSIFEGRAAVVETASASNETVLLISRDITSRKQAELERASMEVQLRQAQKLEAVGQLAAGIAHEINTPTQYISDNVRFLEEAFNSLAEILREEGGLLDEASKDAGLAARATGIRELIQREDLDYLLGEVPRAIQQSLEGLTRVSSIVKAMKIFSHPGVPGRVVVDLNQCVETTCIVARNEWKYVALLDTELDPDLPKISCYPGEVNQMILNLIINAAHAIEAALGGSGEKGRITVRTSRDGDWAVLQVEDTGTGIPKHIQDQVFLPFFTTKAVGKGTGQGLAIVHSVAAKHGGTVGFETEEGRGTTFTVRLPISSKD
ncbi:PAS domain-containing sensor histidine kinase [Mesoterricola silvestris]|nr:ATP-binding protein [Mesoterricola silvestris]